MPGQVGVREVVGHMADTERIFTYRALRSRAPRRRGAFGRTARPNASFDDRPLSSLTTSSMRRATVLLFANERHRVDATRDRQQNSMSVRRLAWVSADTGIAPRGDPQDSHL
jgi:hypothetical protein